jgi:hypothetical protein
MRNLFALLALLGVAGIAFGILTILQHTQGPGATPFRFENYGGPGPIIAGLLLFAGGLYLRSAWRGRD